MNVSVPGAPGIPGLDFRTYRSEEDIPHMVRVMDTAARANGSAQFFTQARLKNWVDHPTSADPRCDYLLTFVDEDLAAVSILQWEDSNEGPRLYQTFGANDTSEAAFWQWSNSPWMDTSLLLMAFDGDEVAAAVQSAIVDEENEAHGYLRGWTDPIFTRRRWRRRGLAAAVLGRTLAVLRDRGMTSAQLGVDTQNPNDALALYRRHRFEPVHAETEWHKPLVTDP